jgi:ADP-heptose:LPS heptosyltransferase
MSDGAQNANGGPAPNALTFSAMRLKRIELWWRALWIRTLVRLMRRSGTHGNPDWGAGQHRVLFLRHDRAGDMIVSTGVMRAIARSHPTIRLDVLASPANAAILDAAPYVDRVIRFDKKKIGRYLATCLELRRGRYDAVIDCMVTAPSLTTLLLILASGARYRIGIAGRGNDDAFNVTVPADDRPNAHMVDLLAALAPAFDASLAITERRPVLELTDEERERAEMVWNAPRGAPRLLVNVSAGTGERTWPEERYAAVIRHVRERAPGTVARVIAAPSETDRGERVASAGGATLARTPSIRDAFALVASADLLLTPDTSITHAASAFRTPSVVLFVRGKAERWGLYDTPGVNVEHTEGTLETLSLERVLSAVDELLDDRLESGSVGNTALREPR